MDTKKRYLEFLFLFFIFSLPITRFVYLYIFSLTFKLPELLGLLLIFIYILQKRYRQCSFEKSPLFYPMAFFIYFTALSLIVNFVHILNVCTRVHGGFEGARMPLPYAIVQFPWAIFSFLMMIITECAISDLSKLKRVFNAFYLSAVIACFCGIFEISRFYLWDKKVIRMVSMGNLIIPKMSSVEYESSMFGVFLVIVFFFLLADLFMSPPADKRRVWLKTLMVLIGACLLLTFSSLAWFSLLIGLLVFAFSLIAKRQFRLRRAVEPAVKIVIIFLILSSILAILFPQTILYLKDAGSYTFRKVFTFEHATGGRRYFALGGLRAFLNHPWFGVGPSQLRFNMQEYVTDNMEIWLLIPASFNLYVDTLAELGIFGFLAFLYIAYVIFRTMFRSLRSAKGKNASFLMAVAIANLCVIYFSMLGISNFYRIITWVVFGMSFAIARLVESPLDEKEP